MGKTTRDEMKAFAGKEAPLTGSELFAYSYSANDQFTQNVLAQSSLEDQIPGRAIDGMSQGNDDRYRNRDTQLIEENGIRRTECSLARQLATKVDHPATIRVVAKSKTHSASGAKTDKVAAPLVNVIPPYTKFFLESVTESRAEKAQVVETFGDFIAFFFGRRPEVYQFGGRLLNTKNHDWRNDFLEVYDNFLRGTKAVENNATVFIQYDDVIAEGFLMNCSTELHGVANNEAPFGFSMLVTRRAPIYQLQRLRERRRRSRFSSAEQQILDDLSGLRVKNPQAFILMQKALGGAGLGPSDIVLYKTETNKVETSDQDPTAPPNSSAVSTDSLDQLLAGEEDVV